MPIHKEKKVPSEVVVAIASAMGRYLRDDKLAFHVVSIKPVHLKDINVWALAGRQSSMTSPRSK